MPFNMATRRKVVPLTSQSRPSGGGVVSWDLPKVGYLARVWLEITGDVAGTLSSPNAHGFSSVVSSARLTANSGIDVFSCSGPGYHWLLRPMLESEYIDVGGYTNARSAVSAAAFDVSMLVPVAMNFRDSVGLINLASEQTVLNLTVNFRADSLVATGATVSATVRPFLEIFTIPELPEDRPPLNVIHQILENTEAVAASGEHTYMWPRGNTVLQIAHGLGFGASGSDGFSNYALRVNQSDYIISAPPSFFDAEYYAVHGSARPAGVLPVDFLGSSGLGNYGLTRDVINTANLTDIASVFTATGAGTLHTVRRQLVVIGAPA